MYASKLFIGLTASIVLGAAITTYNVGLNSSSTLFVLNLYKPWKEKRNAKLTETHLVRVGKMFEIIISLLAMFIAPFIIFASKGFYNYLQQVAGMFSIPIFTIIIVGFVTKKVPAIAAKVGLLFFIICYALSQFVYPVNLHFLHALAILFILTTIVMLIIGKVYPLAIPYKQKYTGVVEVKPWKNRHLASTVLIILMILFFIVFSPLVLAH